MSVGSERESGQLECRRLWLAPARMTGALRRGFQDFLVACGRTIAWSVVGLLIVWSAQSKANANPQGCIGRRAAWGLGKSLYGVRSFAGRLLQLPAGRGAGSPS